jgi:hypothetical protein
MVSAPWNALLLLYVKFGTLAPTAMTIAAAFVEAPIADQTGISAALVALARIGAGFLGGVLTLYLVIQGFQYMASDESTRGAHLKRGLGALLGGAILVLVATTLAPQLVNAIVTGTAGGATVPASTPTPVPTIVAPAVTPTYTLPAVPQLGS